MKNEQEIVRSVFDAYIRDAKAISTKKDRPTFDMLEEVKNMAIKALEQQTSDDCVSRKAVFETIDDCNSDGLKGIFCSYDDGERFKEYVKMLPPVTPTQRWIPVSEELPKKNMPCLVSVGILNLTESAMYSDLMGTIDHKIFWQGDYGHDSFRDITKYVKAWMPLPKPYEEKRGSEDGSN